MKTKLYKMTFVVLAMFSLLCIITGSNSHVANAKVQHIRTHHVARHHKVRHARKHKIKRYHKARKHVRKRRYRKARKHVVRRHVSWARKAERGLSRRNRNARRWISFHESTNRYYVSNGNCYGKFQLLRSSLHGNYSKRNQELTANRYVASRYGSWVNAKAHWVACHWY